MTKEKRSGKEEAFKSVQEKVQYAQIYPGVFISRKILKDMLVDEGFSWSEIKYAMDGINIDWRFHVYNFVYMLKTKKKKKIKKELKLHEFTKREIKYALNAYGIE